MDTKTKITNANLLFDTLPTHYFEGPYIGNGNMGAVIWQDDDGKLLFETSRADFYDHRNEVLPLLYRVCRLKSGNFTLSMDGEKLVGNMEMDLYDAVVSGNLKTSGSEISVRIFNCNDRDVFVIEIKKVHGKCDVDFRYNPYTCESPRLEFMPIEEYTPYPEATFETNDGVNLCIQSLPEDEKYNNVGKGEGEYAAAWLCENDKDYIRIYVSLQYSYPGKFASEIAKNEVLTAAKTGVSSLFDTHLSYYHDFYKNCLEITIPDKRLEKYYYLQNYRFASATTEKGPVLDLLGPWYCPTTWPGIWWNMNEQITYSHISFANHPEFVNPLIDMLYDGRENLAKNTETDLPDAYCLGRASGPDLLESASFQKEYGNLAYLLYYLYESNRTVMDDGVLKEKLLPLMRGALKFLLAKSFISDDGKIHFESSASPEFTNGVEDASYTISAAKWLARTILSESERLGLYDMCDECRSFLMNVTDYHIDKENGFMIGKDMPLNCFHTHWSHFFMVYPYGEYDFETEDKKDVINLTFDKWIQRQEEKFFAGFCTAGAMSLYALKGDGNGVAKRFDYYYNNKDFYTNGMFTDTIYKGRFAPVFETPIGVIRGLEEMLLMCKKGVLHIFNAIPSDWQDAQFTNMRTVGAFLVSAKMEKGKAVRVEIESLAGERCFVDTSNLTHLVCSHELVACGENTCEIMLKKGEQAVFSME